MVADAVVKNLESHGEGQDVLEESLLIFQCNSLVIQFYADVSPQCPILVHKCQNFDRNIVLFLGYFVATTSMSLNI